MPKEPEHQFKLGALVLCRYGAYPYWPATVDQTHQKSTAGKHAIMRSTRGGGQTLAFWCTFMNDESGGWVRPDRMIRYHPELGKKVAVSKSSDYYKDQQKALAATDSVFNKMPKSEEEAKVPEITPDLQRFLDDNEGVCMETRTDDLVSDDDDDTEEEVKQLVTAGTTKTGRPPVRRRKHDEDDPMDLGDTSDDEKILKTRDSPLEKKTTKRRRSSAAAEDSTVKRKRGRPSLGLQSSGKRDKKKSKKEESETPAKQKSVTPRQSAKDRRKDEGSQRKSKRGEALMKRTEEEGSRRKPRLSQTKNEMNGDARKAKDEPLKNDHIQKLEKTEDQLRDAKETIAKLQEKLEATEKRLKESEDSLITFTDPQEPRNVEKDLPTEEMGSSKEIEIKDFEKALDDLKELFGKYETAVDAGKEARDSLDAEKRKLTDAYTEEYNKVKEIESKIPECEMDVVSKLEHILIAKVSVDAMKSVFAGKKVMKISRGSEGKSEAIYAFSMQICKNWIKQIKEYRLRNPEPKEKPTKTEEEKAEDEKESNPKPEADNSERGGKETEPENDITPKKATENDEEENIVMKESNSVEEEKKKDIKSTEVKPKEASGNGSGDKPDDKMDIDAEAGGEERVKKEAKESDIGKDSSDPDPEEASKNIARIEPETDANKKTEDKKADMNEDKGEKLDEKVKEEKSMSKAEAEGDKNKKEEQKHVEKSDQAGKKE